MSQKQFRTTVAVPADLKSRMDEVEDVSWSAVACQAFERKLLELSEHEVDKRLKSVVTRLRTSRDDWAASTPGRAQKAGQEWGEEVATHRQLVSMHNVYVHCRKHGLFPHQIVHDGRYEKLGDAKWSLGARFAFRAFDMHRGYAAKGVDIGPLAEIMAGRVFGEENLNDEGFIDWFVQGAHEVWESVKDFV